jgi:hypothetical protein
LLAVVALLTFLLAAVWGPPPARATSAQSVILAPAQGRPGTTVVVTPIVPSTRDANAVDCSISWDGTAEGAFPCGADRATGLFLTTTVVATGAPGPHTVTVVDRRSGWQGSATFAVLSEVPNLIGARLDGPGGARVQLNTAGLVLGAVSGAADDPAARVVAQTPQPEAAVPASSAVDIVVAVSAPQQVIVPDVRGLAAVDAKKALSRSGLMMVPGNATPGTVRSQSPAAGASVPRGSSVTVTLSTPVGSEDSNRTALLVAVLLILVGIIVALAAATTWLVIRRHRRPRKPKWVEEHVRVDELPTTTSIGAVENHPVPTPAIGIEPRDESRTITIEEVRP